MVRFLWLCLQCRLCASLPTTGCCSLRDRAEFGSVFFENRGCVLVTYHLVDSCRAGRWQHRLPAWPTKLMGTAAHFVKSECGTWSHAVFSSLGARARGGWSGSDASVSHVVRPRQGSGFEGLGGVPLSPKRPRQGPVWSCMGPYISLTSIQDSRVIRRGSSGSVGPCQVPMGFRRNPVLARWDQTGLDGSLDCPVSVHD